MRLSSLLLLLLLLLVSLGLPQASGGRGRRRFRKDLGRDAGGAFRDVPILAVAMDGVDDGGVLVFLCLR
jgi:hypothetical protein